MNEREGEGREKKEREVGIYIYIVNSAIGFWGYPFQIGMAVYLKRVLHPPL